MLEKLEQLLSGFGTQFLKVLSYPILPSQRLFLLYILSSLVFALGVYAFSPHYQADKKSGRSVYRGFLAFLFPSKVWQHPSAWVDVRYFIPHQMLRLWIYTEFGALFAIAASVSVLWSLRSMIGSGVAFDFPATPLQVQILYTLVTVVALDFVAFFIHYLQHKFPLLWEFHKIHHSSEVLHPLSNYREHPIDNMMYSISIGLTMGAVNGLFAFFYGVTPAELVTPILGIGVATFLYSIFGYHLRHSHIWLRWPGIWACLFGCPAHHQIHHSCKPKHINKNFAFMFPVWDILFGTFYLPEREEELVIGLGDGTEHEYRSYFSIYSLPFVNLTKRLTHAIGFGNNNRATSVSTEPAEERGEPSDRTL